MSIDDERYSNIMQCSFFIHYIHRADAKAEKSTASAKATKLFKQPSTKSSKAKSGEKMSSKLIVGILPPYYLYLYLLYMRYVEIELLVVV